MWYFNHSECYTLVRGVLRVTFCRRGAQVVRGSLVVEYSVRLHRTLLRLDIAPETDQSAG